MALLVVGAFSSPVDLLAQDSSNHLPNLLDRTELFNFGKKYPYRQNTELLFELQLAPPLLIYGSRSVNTKRAQALILTPEFRIRVLSSFSGPVVTPSGLIHLRYLRQSRKNSKYYPDMWVLGISHHSNGQDDHTLKTTQSFVHVIDTLNGNFSTHYFDLIYFKQLKKNAFTHWFGLGFQEHFPDSIGNNELPGGMSKFLSENYGRHRVLLFYRLIHKPPVFLNFLQNARVHWLVNFNSSLQGAKGNPIHPEFKDPSKLPTYQLDISVYLFLDWSSDVGFFLRHRSGQDPYNLFFFNNLDQIEFGFSLNAGKLRFGK